MGKRSLVKHNLIGFFNHNLWIIPVSIAVLFFPIQGVSTSPDSSWYLINALNIYNGLGYVNPDLTPVLQRGPVFPGMLASMFWIFGCSVKSAFLLIRVFFVLNIFMIFLIGDRFFNKQTGLIASLLVLSSSTMNIWSSYLLLDNIMPFFVLLFIYFINTSFGKNKSWYFVIAGVCLGTAVLTKEMALIFLPLPLLVLLVLPKRQQYVKGLFFFYISFAGVILSWVIYLYFRTGELYLFLGGGGPKVVEYLSVNSGIEIDFITKIQKYFNNLYTYYILYIKKEFIFSPLFLLSWIYFAFSIITKKKQSDFILLFSLLLFLPIAVFLGGRTFRVGQNMVVYYVIYLILSDFIYSLGVLFSKKVDTLSMHRKTNNYIIKKALSFKFFLLIAFLIVIQIYTNTGMIKLLHGNTLKSFSYYKGPPFKVVGWHDETVKKTAEWIKENCSTGTNFMSDWQYRLSILFFLNGEYNIRKIPYRVFENKYTPSRQKGIISNSKAKPLFIWSQNNSELLKYSVRVLFEEDLIDNIVENKIKYIIVTRKRNFLSIYFDKNPGFIKCMDLSKIKIYQVKNPKVTGKFETMVGSNLKGYMDNMKKKDSHRFELFRTFLVNNSSLSVNEINQIIADKPEKIQINKIY